MADLYLPNLHWFAMKNPFTGSCGNFRFRIVPKVIMATDKEVDFENSTMEAEFWHGLFCYEKSTVEEKQTFPMNDDGRLAMKAWLEENIE